MKCRQDNTVKGTGEPGTCVFCEHETGSGTPWPGSGVVCPCCITIGIQWRAEHDKQPEEAKFVHGKQIGPDRRDVLCAGGCGRHEIPCGSLSPHDSHNYPSHYPSVEINHKGQNRDYDHCPGAYGDKRR